MVSPRQTEDDRNWGRVGGARPPLPATAPLLFWFAGAIVLALVVLPQAIAHPSRPTTVVVSDADEEAPAQDVTDWPHEAVELVELDGDHLLPLHHPQPLADLISERTQLY